MAQKTFPNQVLCPALCGRNRVSPCRTRGNRADFDTLCGTVGNPVLAPHPCRGARATKKRTGQRLPSSPCVQVKSYKPAVRLVEFRKSGVGKLCGAYCHRVLASIYPAIDKRKTQSGCL